MIHVTTYDNLIDRNRIESCDLKTGIRNLTPNRRTEILHKYIFWPTSFQGVDRNLSDMICLRILSHQYAVRSGGMMP